MDRISKQTGVVEAGRATLKDTIWTCVPRTKTTIKTSNRKTETKKVSLKSSAAASENESSPVEKKEKIRLRKQGFPENIKQNPPESEQQSVTRCFGYDVSTKRV